jgi:hypothetical protein
VLAPAAAAYQPSAAMGAGRRDRATGANAAFSDFRYEQLEARVDGDHRGAPSRSRGANPEFKSGQPIELNRGALADPCGALRLRVPEPSSAFAFTEKPRRLRGDEQMNTATLRTSLAQIAAASVSAPAAPGSARSAEGRS